MEYYTMKRARSEFRRANKSGGFRDWARKNLYQYRANMSGKLAKIVTGAKP